MIDSVEPAGHPLSVAAALLRRRPVSRRNPCKETHTGELMRQAAIMIRDLFDKLEKLRKTSQQNSCGSEKPC